jgi:hypothetical protein
LRDIRARLYNIRIILAALSGEPLRAGKGSHPSMNTGPFFVHGAAGAAQHARFAGLSARSGFASARQHVAGFAGRLVISTPPGYARRLVS